MTRINRAAWQRIKERENARPVAMYSYEPASVEWTQLQGYRFQFSRVARATVWKGRSAGFTMGILEQFVDLFAAQAPKETDEAIRRRVLERFPRHRSPTDAERFRL